MYRQRLSTASLARMDSKGAAIRRGDLKISDPILSPHDVGPGINEQFTAGMLSNPTEASITQQGGETYLRKSVPPGFHTRTKSNGGPEPQSQPGAPYHATSRISAVPSMLNSSLASAQSKGSLKKQKDGGIRAKISRMFGSRRLRDTTLSTCIEAHSPPVSTSMTSSSFSSPIQSPPWSQFFCCVYNVFSYCFGMPASYWLPHLLMTLKSVHSIERQTRLMHIRILPILHPSKVRTTSDWSEHLPSMLVNLQDWVFLAHIRSSLQNRPSTDIRTWTPRTRQMTQSPVIDDEIPFQVLPSPLTNHRC